MKDNVIYVDFSKPSRIASKKKSYKHTRLTFFNKLKNLILSKLKQLRGISNQKISQRIRINKS